MKVPGPLSEARRTGIALVLVVLAAVAILVVTGILSVSFQLMGPAGATPPQGGFHVTGGGDNATIRHDVGEPVNGTRLQIRVNGEIRGTWNEFPNGSATVEVGDSITIHDLEKGDSVSLYWIGAEGPQKLVSQTN